MFLHHAADCATIVKRLLLSRLQSLNLSMYMILDINENNRKPSNDGLRLFHLFRTGSAPGGSFRFPIRWSPLRPAIFISIRLSYFKAEFITEFETIILQISVVPSAMVSI